MRNELGGGDSGWSSFAEREVKCIVDWLLRIVSEESLVSEIGRACLMEVGYKSRWHGGQDAIMFVISLVCVSW